MSKTPSNIIESVNQAGRARGGLDPKTASEEQINLTIALLYRASFGLGTVARGEVLPGIGKATEPESQPKATEMGDRWMVDIDRAPTSHEDSIAIGIFLGGLHALAPKRSELGVGGTVAGGRVLVFAKKAHLVEALNGLARQMGDIELLSDPMHPKPAIDCLTHINAMLPTGRRPF